MKYTLEFLETKNKDWKVATITNEAGVRYIDVSINRTNKKGEVFPNFDGIMTGHTVEGEYWETPDKSKKYLFPPRAEKPQGGNRGSGAISKMMDKKAEQIEKAQERKSESIAFFNATNSAITLVSKLGIESMSEAQIRVSVVSWRDWFLKEYENWNAKEPF